MIYKVTFSSYDGDTISRQSAIDAIEAMQIPIMRSTSVEKQFVFKGMSDALNAIKELPSVEPQERKTGRWLRYDGVRCSNCNYKLQTTGLPTVCPNCGSYNGGVCG